MASPSALRVAGPSFSASSQKITKTPRGAVDNGTKPTFTASDMGKSSKNQGCGRVTKPAGRGRNCCPWLRTKCVRRMFRHYGLPPAALPSTTVAGKPRQVNYYAYIKGCHPSAILLTDQRDGSE